MRTAPLWPLLVAACAAPVVPPAPTGAPDPCGLWFHAWTGSSAGTEWALVHEVEGGAHRLTDVFGNGFRFIVAGDGALAVLDEGQGGSGSGAFTGPAEVCFDWRNWGMHFSSRAWRAAHTDAGFPVLPGAPVSGDPALAGDWTAMIGQVGPATGRTSRLERASVAVSVEGPVLILEWPDGTFDKGVFTSANEVVFRALGRAPPALYASPPGCSTSRDTDVIGRAAVGDGAIEVDLFLQTRARVGDQIQSQIHAELRREPKDAPTAASGPRPDAARVREPAVAGAEKSSDC